MKAKPSRNSSKGREQVIKEAQKTNSDDLVLITFQVSRKLRDEFKSITSLNGQKMKDVVSEFMESYIAENK